MLARDVMVSPVIPVTKGATVRDVARMVLEKRISAVPVVDNADKVIGIVTESDLLHRVEAGTERRDTCAHHHRIEAGEFGGIRN
ncbi:CBS domain-containing protein [Bradyrhizobium elkanii]